MATTRETRAQRRERGTCTECANAPEVGVLCSSHWFGQQAKRNAGGRGQASAIRSQWVEQRGRCYYTGQEIVPGETASLDHVTPRAQGGAVDPSNLVWAHVVVNTSKGNQTYEQFLEMCYAVVREHERRSNG